MLLVQVFIITLLILPIVAGLGCTQLIRPYGQEYLFAVLNTTSVQYNSAKLLCTRNVTRGRIAIIRNRETDVELRKYLGTKQFYIGLERFGGAAGFRWTDGQVLDGTAYKGWRNGEPNNVNELCVATSSTGWLDANCAVNLYALCEVGSKFIFLFC
jgi:hypothetical protein